MNIVKELHKQAIMNAKAELAESNRILDTVKSHLNPEDTDTNKMLKYFGTRKIVTKEITKQEEIKNRLKGEILTEENIQSICLKYGLRCLPAEQYVKEIPAKVLNDLRLFKQTKGIHTLYVIAPVSHFKLGPKPSKDPVLLNKTYDENYRPIFECVSQWGNDFNFTRPIYGLITGVLALPLYFLLCAAFILPSILRFLIMHNKLTIVDGILVVVGVLLLMIPNWSTISHSHRWDRKTK